MIKQMTIRMTQAREDELNKFIDEYQDSYSKELLRTPAIFESLRLARRYLSLRKRKRHIIREDYKKDFDEDI